MLKSLPLLLFSISVRLGSNICTRPQGGDDIRNTILKVQENIIFFLFCSFSINGGLVSQSHEIIILSRGLSWHFE